MTEKLMVTEKSGYDRLSTRGSVYPRKNMKNLNKSLRSFLFLNRKLFGATRSGKNEGHHLNVSLYEKSSLRSPKYTGNTESIIKHCEVTRSTQAIARRFVISRRNRLAKNLRKL